jgi:RNA 3'-terminal phosphate cyclase (ATP)
MASLQVGAERMRREKTDEPFGEGSLHSQTARWVAAELLPAAKWFNKGAAVEGVGLSFS